MATMIQQSPTPGAPPENHTRQSRSRIDLVDALRSWLGSMLVVIVLIVLFTSLQPRFMTVLNWQNIAVQMSVLLVVAVAGTLPIMIGSIDLSVGSVATLAGVLLAYFLAQGGALAAMSVPLALLAAAACGVLNGVLVSLLRVPSFLATLGTFFALDGLASFVVDGTPVPIDIESTPSLIFSGSVGPLPVIFLWALLVWAIAVVLCWKTRLGRHFFALGGSEPAAIVAGVPVRRVKATAFVVSGLLAGFAGVLLSIQLLSGSPQQGGSLLLPSIGAIVIGGTALSGGVGGPHRTIVGVLLLTVLINGMQLLSVNPFLQLMVQGAVVILAVITGRKRSDSEPVK